MHNYLKVCPDFSSGDIVVHRASGKKAVVEWVHRRCINTRHSNNFDCLKENFKKCQWEFLPIYDLSVDFGVTVKDVPENLIVKNVCQ